MKRFFGLLLFVVGAVEFLFTVAAFFVVGFQSIFLASFIISVFLLVFGFALSYEPSEELSEEDLKNYRKNGSIGDRLGQL